MTRKDTILIGVIVNACILAVLFLAAFIYDTGEIVENVEPQSSLATNSPVVSDPILPVVAIAMPTETVVQPNPRLTPTVKVPEYSSNSILVETTPIVQEMIVPSSDYREVVIKKGDSLDKIARMNGTNVAALKKLNNLQTNNLTIGKSLKIPPKTEDSTAVAIGATQPIEKKVVPVVSEPVYYTVQPGDSPWKISKQTNVNIDVILKLNNLNEEKARNLKVGDRIRVK